MSDAMRLGDDGEEEKRFQVEGLRAADRRPAAEQKK